MHTQGGHANSTQKDPLHYYAACNKEYRRRNRAASAVGTINTTVGPAEGEGKETAERKQCYCCEMIQGNLKLR